MTLILASASPRRRELLTRITGDFEVVAPLVSECTSGDAAGRVLASACAKARDVASRRAGVIVGADTLVVVDGEVLGKPSSRSDASRILRRLSGREHSVFTGLCVLSSPAGLERTAVEETLVRFRDLGWDEITDYVSSGEPDGKAGAYAIQGQAAHFVERIDGDYTNVIGLPLSRLVLLLREVGLPV